MKLVVDREGERAERGVKGRSRSEKGGDEEGRAERKNCNEQGTTANDMSNRQAKNKAHIAGKKTPPRLFTCGDDHFPVPELRRCCSQGGISAGDG